MQRTSRQHKHDNTVINTAIAYAASINLTNDSMILNGALIPINITTINIAILTNLESLMQKYLTLRLSQARKRPNITSSPLYTYNAPMK